jgi:hypothetical protein
MKNISGEQCIELMKETFPHFLHYWDKFIQDFGADEGLSIQMIPFGDYAIDMIKSNNVSQIIRIFDFVEYMLIDGDEPVQNAIATSFLEYLQNQDPDEIQFSKFSKYMGKEAIAYCKAWDEFTGCRTEGLWDNDQRLH